MRYDKTRLRHAMVWYDTLRQAKLVYAKMVWDKTIPYKISLWLRLRLRSEQDMIYDKPW